MIDDNGDSLEELGKKEAFKGAIVKLSELQRQDGLIARSIDESARHNQSVIMTTITAVPDDKDYRQILKRAMWRSTEEMDLYVQALAGCDYTGAVQAKKHLLDRITAHSAGIEGQIQHDALEALTHTTFTTRALLDKKYHGSNDGNKTNSPIA